MMNSQLMATLFFSAFLFLVFLSPSSCFVISNHKVVQRSNQFLWKKTKINRSWWPLTGHHDRDEDRSSTERVGSALYMAKQDDAKVKPNNTAYESLAKLKRNVIAVDEQLQKRKMASNTTNNTNNNDEQLVSPSELIATAKELELETMDLESDEQALAAMAILASRYMLTVEKSEQALALAMSKISKLESDLIQSQTTSDTRQQQLQQTKSKYKQLQKHNTKLTSKVKNFESLVEVVKKDTLKANEERQRAQDELKQVQSIMKDLQGKLDKSEQVEIQLKQTLLATNKTMQESTIKLNSLLQKESILKSSVLKTRDEYKTLQHKYQRVQLSLNRALEKIALLQKDITLIDELKPAFIALYEEYQKLKDMNSTATTTLNEMILQQQDNLTKESSSSLSTTKSNTVRVPIQQRKEKKKTTKVSLKDVMEKMKQIQARSNTITSTQQQEKVETLSSPSKPLSLSIDKDNIVYLEKYTRDKSTKLTSDTPAAPKANKAVSSDTSTPAPDSINNNGNVITDAEKFQSDFAQSLRQTPK